MINTWLVSIRRKSISKLALKVIVNLVKVIWNITSKITFPAVVAEKKELEKRLSIEQFEKQKLHHIETQEKNPLPSPDG